MEEATLEKKLSQGMIDFVDEIARLKKREARLGGTVHLKDIELSELTQADLRLWEAYKSGTIRPEDLDAHKKEVRLRGEVYGPNHTSFEFKAFVVNLETKLQLEKQNQEATEKDELQEAA
jgi:hypothetical protein